MFRENFRDIRQYPNCSFTWRLPLQVVRERDLRSINNGNRRNKSFKVDSKRPRLWFLDRLDFILCISSDFNDSCASGGLFPLSPRVQLEWWIVRPHSSKRLLSKMRNRLPLVFRVISEALKMRTYFITQIFLSSLILWAKEVKFQTSYCLNGGGKGRLLVPNAERNIPLIKIPNTSPRHSNDQNGISLQ